MLLTSLSNHPLNPFIRMIQAMKYDWNKMQKSTCLFIVMGFVVTLATGCATPLAQQKTDPAPGASVTSGDVTHIIAPGDRLSDIALKYTGKVSQWKAIATYNNITDPRTLRIGDSVKIPASMLTGNTTIDKKSIELPKSSSTNVATGTMALQRTRDTGSDAGDVKVEPVTTNRSFQLERMDESDIGKTRTEGVAPPRVRVIGTYYPKGVYQQPASYSELMMRVTPGTVFELDREVNDWYKVITSEGIGYLRTVDGKLVEE